MTKVTMRLAAALATLAAIVSVPAAMADEGVEAVEVPGEFTPAWTPIGLSDEPVTVVAELAGKPAALVQAQLGRKLTPGEKAQVKADLKAKQDAVAPAIRGLGATILAQYQVALNGIKVQIARGKLGDLAAVRGVTAVLEVAVHEPDNATSVPFIGTPAAWNGAAGFRGESIKVAIIDTGVDYTHANFGGPGTTAAYNTADAADTLPADATLFGPAAPKVKGGIDLVGDNYNAGGTPAQRVPQPDPNPLDCNTGNAGGHGSHVSGTAAGFGVKADGTTYTGPYDTTTFPDTFTIGPGVAPKADIYAVRVFGCSGSTAVTVDAIEWAVDNDMDVINMSLGSNFGAGDDASAIASSNAAAAGVVVVASAGNAGANQYITGSPATGTGTLSVAANDVTEKFPAAVVSLSTGKSITALNANDAALPSGAKTVAVLRDSYPSGPVSLGCSESNYTSFPGGIAGKLVVTRRGVCSRVARAIWGEKHGAAAVAMINDSAGFPPFEGKITGSAETGPFEVTIPFLGIKDAFPGSADGQTIVAADGGTATLSPTTINNPGFKAFAGFTSGGPRRSDSWLKPDITAPGVSTLSTAVGTGNQGRRASGTSMSAPHVTGVAALTVQAHPGWTVEDLKAAIVNTADPAGVAGYRTSRGGAGLVQPAKSTKTLVVAVGDPATATLNFGFSEFGTNFTATKTITLRNHGTSDATFNVGSTPNSPFTSPHSIVSAGSVTVPAGGSATLDVTLNVPVATVGSSSASGLSFREVAGLVTLTPADATMNSGIGLRVPYYLVPRALSNIETDLANRGKFTGSSTSTPATVQNKGTGIAGNADVYAWGLSDPPDKGVEWNDLRAVGVQSFPRPTAADPNRRLLVFAISNHDRASSHSLSEFDINIDVNNDGVFDYVAVVADLGLLQTGSFNGRIAVAVFPAAGGTGSLLFFATGPTDSSTVLAPVRTDQLCRAGLPCLNVSNPRFTYGVESFTLRVGSGDDTIAGTAKFNGWTSSISQGNFISGLAPGASATYTVSVNPSEWALTPALGQIVVSYDDKANDEAQTLPVTFTP